VQELGYTGGTMPEVPPMLVLSPTRELALQVMGTCRAIQKLTGLRSACVYGGVPKEQQVRSGSAPECLGALGAEH
jgi:superfamily II DNA/RNA helicase